VRLSALGDVINTLPALTALRRARPEAHIVWVVEAASAGLLREHPLLDGLIVAERTRWAQSLRRLRGIAGSASQVRELLHALRAEAFDVAIDFQGNLRSGLITFMTRARLRIGLPRKDTKELSFLLTNHRVKLPDGPLHRVERGLCLLRACGIDTAEAAPIVPVTQEDRQEVDEFLAASGLAGSPFAVIHAGTSAFGRYKQWPNDRWAEVARRLAGELGLRVVLTRGPEPAEAEGAAAIAAGTAALVAPLLSLRELGELFRRVRLFLSVDTGPMHLASAVGAPVVALFGPKDPRVYGPYFGPRAIVEKPAECRPCRKRSCDDPRCMLAITPDDVLASARLLLDQTTIE
jgi:lipopolysaccharide heptosyltransferase I